MGQVRETATPSPSGGRRVWVVTSPHETPRRFGGTRSPWGLRHVRPDGVAVTACGLPTGSWPSFWALDFSALDASSCPACARVFLIERPRDA